MAQLSNLTPHPIRVYGWDVPDRFNLGEHEPQLTLEPSGTVARIGEIELGTQYLGVAVPVEFVQYGGGVDMPPRPGKGTREWDNPVVYYVVSLALALSEAGKRTDLLVPFREIRNHEGTVIGCRSLAHAV